jgi:hypothetical protein
MRGDLAGVESVKGREGAEFACRLLAYAARLYSGREGWAGASIMVLT